jgi:hypothetical protein
MSTVPVATADKPFEFSVLYPDGIGMTPHVSEYPDLGIDCRIEQDERVTDAESITILFEYPLTNPVELSFTNTGGFTFSSFWGAVYLGYTHIYATEPEPTALQELEKDAPLLNRPDTDGEFGIYLHTMSDLFLEGFYEHEPGKFKLLIGS